MTMDKLKLRNAMKKRKPTFERQYANLLERLIKCLKAGACATIVA